MRVLVNTLLLALLTLSLACNQSQPAEESAEGETMEQEGQAMADTETMSEEDEKAKRPSPPRQASGTVGTAGIVIDYGSPSVKGREIWGGLIPYGEVWRTGANEATTFEVTEDVLIEGQPLPAGKYALFTIPGEDSWTVIFNRVHEQWGAGNYDPAEDALRVEVTPQPLGEPVEAMEITLEDGQFVLRWANLAVPVQVGSPS